MKKIIITVFSLFLSVFCLCSCANNSNAFTNDPVKKISFGGSLPDINAKDLSLGELYSYDVPELLKEHYEDEGYHDVTFFASSDMSKYFSFGRKKNVNSWNLEQVQQNILEKKSLNTDSCRIGDSEVFKMQDYKIQDVFYTDFQFNDQGSPLFLQCCLFLDGQDIVYWEFGYRCFKAGAGYSGVNVHVPIINQPQIFEDKFSWNNVRYSFENDTEIPTIILMSTENDVESVLNKIVAENSSVVSRKKIDGMDAYVTEDQHIVYGNVEYERARGYIIEHDGIVSVITFCDPTGVNSHAFDALEKGITKPN